MAKKKTRSTKAAKKTRAKAKTGGAASKKASPARGRRRADWKHTSFAEIEAWRTENRLPKYRTAELLGISNGTYHNWAKGRAVPSLSTQRKLKEMIQGPAPSGGGGGGGGEPDAAPARNEALRAATEILNTYLETHPGKLSPDRFTRLVREVLMAVS